MSQETIKYKRSLSGSVGAGVKSVFAGNGRRYYELVHKTASAYHKAGSVQKIIIDTIELGRDPKCQVRFDESFATVSRRHAAIVKDGTNWKLIQLSRTNSTYLNGSKVNDSWYLQNGDEIQLSNNGPVLGFIIPEGDAGLTKSIGLTQRLSLFRQQALKPYKTALWCLLAAILVIVLVGSFYLHKLHKQNKELKDAVELFEEQSKQAEEDMQHKMDSLARVNVDMTKQMAAVNKRVKAMSGRINKMPQSQQKAAKSDSLSSSQEKNKGKGMASIEECFPYVYYIETYAFEIKTPDGTVNEYKCEDEQFGWSGTGFLLSDGRFVTARHVIEGWQFWNSSEGVDERMQALNAIMNNGGDVVFHFYCISPTGNNFSCTSKDFHFNRSQDQGGVSEDGVKLTHGVVSTDYAYMRTGFGGGLAFDDVKCDHLKMKTELTILGYPLGEGINSIHDISPIYGNATVASDGLQRGRILTTNTNAEHGNSGGPVFYVDEDGLLVVVGLVSGGRGSNLGNIIPMSRVR